MKTITVCLVILLFLISAQTYEGGKKSGKSRGFGPELLKAPENTKQWQNPFAGQEDAMLAGKKLFHRYCADCHGKDGKGDKDAPDLHSAYIQTARPGQLFWFLKNGNLKEGMPAWSRLPEQQLWQLVTYLQAIMMK